jgi:2-haloacid dehalogenase
MTNAIPMNIKALAFDTGGTAFNWHDSLVQAFTAIGSRRNLDVDWHEVTNDWRQRSLQHVLGKERLDGHMDDVHRHMLDLTLSQFGLDDFTRDERGEILRAWYELDAWPDFAPAIAQMRSAYQVISLTLLPVSLVVHNSRSNGIDWDAIFSGEMIGTYKPHPRAYTTAAAWLNLDPSEILMIACHNIDLNAAHKVGFRTAFVHRRTEWGPNGRSDGGPNMEYDFVEESFGDLARRLVPSL